MLTKAVFEKLRKKAAGRRAVLHSVGRGLNLQIRPTGSASWLFRSKFDGKALSVVLGDYPGVTQEDAEALAEKCHAWIREGADPRSMLRLQRDIQKAQRFTVRDACEYWLSHTSRENPEKARQSFERHVYPHIGDQPIDSLALPHWLAVLDAVSTGRHTGRAAPVQAGMVLANLKLVMQLCRLRGLCSSRALDDLTIGIVGRHSKISDRVLTDGELVGLLRWTNDSKNPRYYRRIMRLLLSFGCRSAELRLSKLPEWDLRKNTWTVPAEHAKSRQIIVRPIPPALVPLVKAMLEEAKQAGSDMFMGETRPQSTVSGYVRRMYEKLGHAKWSAHDLRRTFVTELNEKGVPPNVVELLVGHVIQGVSRRYNHSLLLNEKREALTLWCNELAKLERHNLLEITKHG